MMWIVDDDGSMMFRIQGRASAFGPQRDRAGMLVVQQIMQDMVNNSIDTETIGTFTRIKRTADGDTAETIWKGRLLRIGQVAEAREYFVRLARSYNGD